MRPRSGCPTLGHRLNRAGHRRLVETLAHVPRLALFLGPPLNVAARQVEADGIAENQAFCGVDRDIRPAGTERDDQLDLMVQIFGRRRVGDADLARAADHRVARLHEEKGRLAPLGLLERPHFTGVIGIVAADAVDATNRKRVGTAGNRHGGEEMRRKDESHGGPFR